MMSKGCCLSGTVISVGGTHRPGLGPVPGWLKQIVRCCGSGGTCNKQYGAGDLKRVPRSVGREGRRDSRLETSKSQCELSQGFESTGESTQGSV